MIDFRQVPLLFEECRLLSEIIFFEKKPIPVWKTRSATYIDYGDYRDFTPWETKELGTEWKCRFDEARWFEAEVTVPESMAGKRLVLELSLGGEGLVSVNGKALSGATDYNQLMGGKVAPRTRIDLTDSGVPGTVYRVSFQTNMNYKDFYKGSRYHRYSDASTASYRMKYAWLCAVDDAAEALLLDLETVLAAAESFRTLAMPVLFGERLIRAGYSEELKPMIRAGRTDALYQGLLDAARAALGELRFFEGPEALRAGVPAASKALHAALEKLPRHDLGGVTVSGFAHMDIVWLWEDKHTVRKVENTFRNALALIRRYPDYLFTFSQPYVYELMEKHCPELFEEIREAVRNGNIDPIGNLWIESDMNLPAGEALVRQLLYGHRYQMKTFGRDSRVFFLPDSFGFPASLPQIIRRAGMEYFFTSKLSTNEQFRFPRTYFLWKGIDGSTVRSYVMRVAYNGRLTPERLTADVVENENKALTDRAYLTFGYGDGGGGADWRMIETAHRFRDLSGIPRVTMGRLEDHLREVFPSADEDEALPVWDDELYLDRHRGTFTTMGLLKKLNRRSEFALRRLEIFSSLAALLGGDPYPGEELDALWKELLRLQFHDRLPGSSIPPVNRDAAASFTGLLRKAASLEEEKKAVLGRKLTAPVLFNTLSFPRTVQTETGVRYLPAFGWSPEETPFSGGLRAEGLTLENRFFRLRFGEDGRLLSLWDKTCGREALAAPGNRFRLYAEIAKPQLSAWDIHPESEEKELPFPAPEEVRVSRLSEREAALSFTYTFGGSRLTQEAVVYADIPRIDFRTRADWQENMKMLKVSFAPALHAREAAFEIQFGTLARPTHRNTAYDAMRYEVPAHRFADLSASDYGLSLLNDCKYGYETRGDELLLTLLRAPMEPDPAADRGTHEFTYSLFPHSGGWGIDTVRAGLELNEEAVPVPASGAEAGLPEVFSFFRLSDPKMILDCFKQAEDGDGYIVRLYEATGGSGTETLTSFLPFARVTECDLMEENETEVPSAGGSFSFPFRAFEIRTFRLRF